MLKSQRISMLGSFLALAVFSGGCEIEKPIKKPGGNTLSPGTRKAVIPGLEPAPPTAIGESKTTKSGVKYETVKEGSGEPAKAGQTVVMHYTGKLENGTVFDSSRTRGEPFTTEIGVGSLIRGWDEAIPGMKPGEVRKLTIPSEAGYGERGTQGIPPNATLFFEVELIQSSSD